VDRKVRQGFSRASATLIPMSIEIRAAVAEAKGEPFRIQGLDLYAEVPIRSRTNARSCTADADTWRC